MDKYQGIREMPFPVLAQILGLDMGKFKSRKGGTEWAGSCPIHQPKRNSTSFSYASDGKFNCFSCDAKGRGAIDLYMKMKGGGFQEAVTFLEPHASTAGLVAQAKRPEIKQVEVPQVKATENEAKTFTYEKYYQPSEWLQKRNLAPGTLQRYGVGLYSNPSRKSAYQGRVMLRIQRFTDGAVVGYLARDIRPDAERGDSPKYIVPPGLHKSLELWGAWQLKEKAPYRLLYVVESAFSVMHFHQLGLPAVALLGWSVSEQQLDILSQLAKGVVYLPDSDKQKEAQGYAGLLATKMWVKFPEFPGNDPEQLSIDQVKSLT